MIRFLVVLAYLMYCFPSEGQVIYERTYRDAFPSIRQSIELSDTSTFSVDRRNWSLCNKFRVRHIDRFGKIIDTLAIGGEAFMHGYHWIGHDSVLIWSEQGAYDVGPDYFYIHLWTPEKVSTIFSEKVQEEHIPGRSYGAYVFRPDFLIYEKSDTLFLRNHVIGENEKVILKPGLAKVIEFKSSILTLYSNQRPRLYDQDLNEVRQWTNFPDTYIDTAFALPLDSFWISRDPDHHTHIDAVNVFTESVHQIDVSDYLDTILEIQINRGYLFVSGLLNDNRYVIQFDKSLDVINVHQLDIPVIKENMELTFSPTRVYAWATDGMGKYRADYRICYAYTQPYQINKVDISIDSMWLSEVQHFPHYSMIRVATKVRNRSDEVLKGFTLHYDVNESGSTCFSGTNAFKFGNLAIEPGSTGVVSYNDYTTRFAHNADFHREYFVEHGNNQLNADTSDNRYDLLHLFTSLINPGDKEYKAFPNPFTDGIQVDGVPEYSQLFLYNQMGQLVSEGKGQLNNLGALPTGIYTLQINNGHTSNVQQLVKVE